MTNKTAAPPDVVAEWVPIDSLVPWDRNPRLNDHAVDRVAASIREFGWAEVIVARRDDNMIIGGHTRHKAAKKLGLADVPVRFLDVSREVAEKLAIALNKLGEVSAWDENELAKLLSQMESEDIQLIGFSDAEAAELKKLADDSWATSGAANVGEIEDYDAASETYVVKIDKVSAADKDRLMQVVNDVLQNAGFKYAAKAF